MANKKIKMHEKNANGTYDVLHPETTSNQVYDAENGKWLSEIIGLLNSLDTAERSSLVNSINSLKAELHTHASDDSTHITYIDKSNWNAKYSKPVNGIPKTDLASGVRLSLEKADTAIQEINEATTDTKGIVKLNNTLTSTSTGDALTAAQGKVLRDLITALSNNKQDILSADKIRKITISTDEATGGSDGDIWLQY